MKKIINDQYVIAAYRKGINGMSSLQMMNSYTYITGTKLEGNCSKCAKRNAWKTIVCYVLPIINKNK